ncbi:hypothetical protein LguiB_018519 [Lonicera macranthoides]
METTAPTLTPPPPTTFPTAGECHSAARITHRNHVTLAGPPLTATITTLYPTILKLHLSQLLHLLFFITSRYHFSPPAHLIYSFPGVQHRRDQSPPATVTVFSSGSTRCLTSFPAPP